MFCLWGTTSISFTEARYVNKSSSIVTGDQFGVVSGLFGLGGFGE